VNEAAILHVGPAGRYVALIVACWAVLANAQPNFPPIAIDNPTPATFTEFAAAVASIGDVNGDSVPDILIGAEQQDIGGNARASRGLVFRGRHGRREWRWHPRPAGGRLIRMSAAIPGPGQAFLFVSTPTEVAGDILPKSINVHKQGVIPVAILATSEFDATSVNPSSVRFGPANATATHNAMEDVDDDGDIDLLLKFNAPQTGIVCGSTRASLTGKTFDGEPVQGSDSFKTVGCPKP